MISTLILILIMVTSLSYRKNSVVISRLISLTLLLSAMLVLNIWTPQALATGLVLFNGLLSVDSISTFLEILLLVTGSAVFTSYGHTNSTERTGISLNYCYLILFSLLGASILVGSTNFLTLFLAIELQSFAVYVLAGLYRDYSGAISASLKYFLIGALSSTFILLGSGIIYGNTGLTSFADVLFLINVDSNSYLVLGGLFILVGLLTKIAVAPFHYWAPDVYDGVPTYITIYLTLLPKISIVTVLVQLMLATNNEYLEWFIIATASLSLVVGSVLGLRQVRIKRLLTYSTISHLAYITIPLSYLTFTNLSSLLFYLAQYTVTNLNAFLVLIAMGTVLNSYRTRRGDITNVRELTMIMRHNSALAMIFALCLFSFSGIPPLAGFFGKLAVLYGVIEQGNYGFALLAVVTSVVSAVYYLTIIRTAYAGTSDSLVDTPWFLREHTSVSTSKLAAIDHSGEYTGVISSSLGYTISVLTNAITLIFFVPQVLQNSIKLVALTQFLV